MVLAVISAGFFAGFISTIAGSGSLISLPLLIALGLPVNIANGTNRVAILLQNLVGVGSFKAKNIFTFREGILYAIPTIFGAILGAELAVELDENLMKIAISVLLFIMFFIILLNPKAWLKKKEEIILEEVNKFKKYLKISVKFIIFFAIGVYGGFIQVGVGLFLLAGLVLGAKFDLIKANGIKVFIILLFTIAAISVFIINGQVDYKIGLILAIGNMAGAYVATKVAIKKGAKFIRFILLFVTLLAAIEISGLRKLIFSF